MAAYKDLVGQKITKVTSNPGEPKTGQMWYNSTDGKLRGLGIIEATRSATSMTTKRSLFGSGLGTSTAGLTVGGLDDSTYLNAVEEWNGSGWSAGGNYPTYRYGMGCAGTQTAAMSYCGRVPSSPGPGSPAETYEYDGSSWTSGNSFPTGANSLVGIGAVDTAVVSTEDYNDTNMHHWNGTSWTSANARNVAKGGQAAFGSQTAAVLAGGYPDSSTITEVYDGTNWTSGNTMNTGRGQISGAGTQTDGLAFGGDKPPSEAAQTTIESWDGTSWATSPATLATARTRAGAGRNTASGTWVSGGIGPGGGGEGFDSVEIYEKSTNSITAAAWASGGNMNTARAGLTGFGTQTAAIAANGDTYPPSSGRFSNAAEEYDGSSWTSISSTNSSTAYASASKLSSSGAGSVFGGEPVAARHEYWNGSAWSEQTDPNTPSYSAGGAGTQTASIKMGGVPGAPSNTGTEEWNGSSWANQNDMPHGVTNSPGTGLQTAALIFGGNNPAISTTAEYDGTNWTTSGNMILGREQLGGSGTQTDALAFGGRVAPPTDGKTETEGYDGTSWSTRPSLGTGVRQLGSSGAVSSASLAFGGLAPGKVTTTEEFTGETSTINIADFTTS